MKNLIWVFLMATVITMSSCCGKTESNTETDTIADTTIVNDSI